MNYEKATQELQEYFTENQEPEGKLAKVSISELEKFNPELSDYFRDEPEEAKKAVKETLEEETVIRLTDLPEEELLEIDNIGAKHIGKLVAVKGLITDIEDVKVESESAVFECTECGDLVEKDQRDIDGFKSPYKCDTCGNRKFKRANEEYFNVQNFTLSADNSKLECRLNSGTLDTDEYLDRQTTIHAIPTAEENEVKLLAETIEITGASPIDDTESISSLIGSDSDNTVAVLNSLNPLEFEKLIARIFQAEGWKTELTSPTGDQGIDIIARKRLPVPQKFVIQVKHYEESKVTPDEVQQYNSLKEQEPNTDQAVLITSSTYTDKAKELADSLEIKTLDRDYVIRMINQIEQ